MSEIIGSSHENKAEAPLDNAEAERRLRDNAERLREEAEKAEASRDSLEKIHERLEQATRNQEKIQVDQLESKASDSPLPVGAQLRASAVHSTLKKVRKQLSGPERAGSRVIHQPAVEAVSAAAGATVARPSGLLVGGAFSLLANLLVLYICRRYGYEYNFLIGLTAFAAGFALGLIIEAVSRLFRRQKV